ncbi:MAG: MBL fold metallo-hydrolase [Clostridia bacterium]|nr:MBL fold metallo-hydrolase [Clostridia bacterium]
MKITVLGKYGPFPNVGGSCSGCLIEHGKASIVLDMGNGTLSNLLKVKPELNIDALLLSSLRSDHMSDALILRYALLQFKAHGKNVPFPLSVLLPSAPEAQFRELSSSGVFDMLRIEDSMRVRFGGLTVTFHQMPQPIPTFALQIDADGKKVIYTGDTNINEKLVTICQKADILLASACFLSSDKTGDTFPHMTAADAADLALKANVKQLICTHIWGGYTDEHILGEVHKTYPTAIAAQQMHTSLV